MDGDQNNPKQLQEKLISTCNVISLCVTSTAAAICPPLHLTAYLCRFPSIAENAVGFYQVKEYLFCITRSIHYTIQVVGGRREGEDAQFQPVCR